MLERIRACLASLAPAEQRVATLVLRDPAGAAYRQRQTPAAAARDESQPARQALPIKKPRGAWAKCVDLANQGETRWQAIAANLYL